jgi:coenzyme F420-dependent glucose-6-phosphate dehydrogenase
VARTLATLTSRFPGRPFLGVASDELELVVGLLAEESLRTPVYVSASDDAAAHLAGRLGDGLWTSADPAGAPALIEAYHEGRAEAGKDDGEILLQASFAWEPAFVGAPARSAVLEQQTAADAQSVVVSARPDEHVERIREIERLGATAVVLTNVSGSPLEAVRAYGRDVLPKLRG